MPEMALCVEKRGTQDMVFWVSRLWDGLRRMSGLLRESVQSVRLYVLSIYSTAKRGYGAIP